MTGIDELLNYHYLVSEYIMSSEMTVSEFMNLTKERKTEVIWNELFIRMTPVSEATRGVVNVLKGLGMAKGERLRLCEEIFPAGYRVE